MKSHANTREINKIRYKRQKKDKETNTQHSLEKVLHVMEEKESTYEGKSPVLFEIWLFRSSQPSGDDDCRMYAAIISTVFASENHCTGHNP